MGLKGGISIDADSGPLGYICTLMLWSISQEEFTFIHIGLGHTVVKMNLIFRLSFLYTKTRLKRFFVTKIVLTYCEEKNVLVNKKKN